jgi:hypothetical protein
MTDAVLQIRIRKDPKLLAGSGSDPDPIRIRNKHFGSGFESGFESGFKFGSETGSKTGSKTNLSKGVLFLGQKKVISDNFGIFQHFQVCR